MLAITGSAAQAGLVAAAQTVPFLIWFLPAGGLVDRWPRKRIMLAADAGRAGAVPTFAALATCLAIVAAASTASQQIRRAARPERPHT